MTAVQSGSSYGKWVFYKPGLSKSGPLEVVDTILCAKALLRVVAVDRDLVRSLVPVWKSTIPLESNGLLSLASHIVQGAGCW